MSFLLIAISAAAGLVLYNMGHTKGYKDGYHTSTIQSALTIKSFLDWLPGDDRMHFTNKLRDFQLEKFKSVILKALDGDEHD